MPIRPFLSGQAFDPETITTMSIALQGACEALGLRMTDDPAAKPIAEKVIEFAHRGIRDPDTLRTMVLKEFSEKDGHG
jgi:hypothetical protein